ncbi:hypothetical protein [Streptomyces anandii]|uniref:hypothetical protein n=1 Tax=Streptomyces anandii TaxID=285454 RepID=UPI00167AF24C|nr:hypothetical protein [Streptomyces anandii]GGY00209.1 hypothetical protein GCM10010510_52390 [Streptomyces anandii JCM 4720]
MKAGARRGEGRGAAGRTHARELPERPSAGPGPALVVVGAGPRGTGLIERIAANAPEL